ncbi:uncharacterized protein LOC121369178 isoform X2 [Gigantopelta aegis]|uniref:uncharacterized protein LOC121369178 isoform X2 n=1 Tax=Gigantopelta aegis TaxID=1735272 RepID=UPI001B88A630|nr:uncharacterized protein LOC121369178 isoform X2 [Gigantopelta aegis]
MHVSTMMFLFQCRITMKILVLAVIIAAAAAHNERSLGDFLASATKGTKLGAAFEVIDAFGKVSKLIEDLKHIAPTAHTALTDSIKDIKGSIKSIVSHLARDVVSGLKKRGLADFLASATKGTKLGAAFDVINAFGKVSKFIKDLKNIAPAAHKALTGSIKDIKDSMNTITSKLTGEIESNLGKRGLSDFLASATKGTKLGAAFDVINAFGKISKFIKDLKNIAPAAHKALTGSIKAIKDSMNNITSKLTGEIESNLGKRGLADFLASATKGTKLGAAFDIISAFGKVSKFIKDLKNIAPAAHKALTGSIKAIKDSMNNITSKLTGEIESNLGKRGLADFLASATKGTKLGAAFDVINAFGKISKFIKDLKNIAPAAHKALTGSIKAIKDSMNNITSKLTGEIESNLGKRGLADFLASATKGTKLGAAFDVINAFGKISKFIKDLKNIAPAAHKALTGSIKAIKDSMNNITSKLTGEIESNLGRRSLSDLLASVTKGTSLGKAFDIISAFSKVSKLISDVKHIAPAAHAALTDSIKEVKGAMSNIVSQLVHAL